MSAEKPEVGDVWEHKLHKSLIHITEIGENYIGFIGVSFTTWPNDRTTKNYYENSFGKDDERQKHFLEIYKYLGKSKASIEDLFEVEQNLTIEDYIERIDDWLLKN